MAAGSVISAMMNRQDTDLMGGFRRALPLTSALLIAGALALAAFPGTSGFFSKDEILYFASERGGMYMIFTIGGYVGAFLTAIYAFRIGFRVVAGPPCPEARELEQGQMPHGEPENPHTGEREDTDVGFPGAEHHIAERTWPMAVAMSVLGFGALFGGVVQIPGVTHLIDSFLAGTFDASPLYHIEPSVAGEWVGLGIGALISIAGIAVAWYCWVARRGEVTPKLIARLPRLHRFLFNKWYFDQLQDALVYRPAIAIGRFASAVFERYVVDGLVTGTTGIVRGAGVVVRGSQSGFMRAYALLLVGGLLALAFYFLIVSS